MNPATWHVFWIMGLGIASFLGTYWTSAYAIGRKTQHMTEQINKIPDHESRLVVLEKAFAAVTGVANGIDYRKGEH